MPRGAPRIWTDDYYKRIFQVPGRVIILTERNMQYRQIFTDGRPLPKDPNPTWNGNSTGHWEGDTLVVETTGFRDDLWLDAFGNPLTDQGKMTERIRRLTYRAHHQRVVSPVRFGANLGMPVSLFNLYKISGLVSRTRDRRLTPVRVRMYTSSTNSRIVVYGLRYRICRRGTNEG
jgi:hypothetical protein